MNNLKSITKSHVMYFCNPYIYYTHKKEYQQLIKNIKDKLIKLQSSISVYAFGNIRGGMGIKKLEDLDISSNDGFDNGYMKLY